MLKDHYEVLGLPPSATVQDIRKAYRRLAQQFHPDKTRNDPYAREKFHAIKEAYEVLTNPARKEKYLQERWYEQAIGSKQKANILTPETMLLQLINLDRHLQKLDLHRMDKVGLANYVATLLSIETIQKMNEFSDVQANDQIIVAALRCIEPLDRHREKSLLERLKLLDSSETAKTLLERFTARRMVAHRWEKQKIWLVILAVLALCALIIFAAS